jgi:Holliday junction resolvasome RuvABC endonuclease subunit
MGQRRKNGIISLDVASRCTGWCYMVKDNLKAHGCIETRRADSLDAKLNDFKRQLGKLYKKFNPSHVVIEDIYYANNAVTFKVLSYFTGVARELAYAQLGIEPHMVTTGEVRGYFGIMKRGKGKEVAFNMIKKHYGLRGFNFKDHNDITDAIAQGLYYYNKVILDREWPNKPKSKKKTKPRKKRKR